MSDSPLAPLFEPPYWVVVFTSQRTAGDGGYGAMAVEMERLAAEQPGYLGIESAQRQGRADWYRAYRVRVAKVEREYGFDRDGE